MKKMSLMLVLAYILTLFAACAPESDKNQISSAAAVKPESVKPIVIDIDDSVARELVLKVHSAYFKELIVFDTSRGGGGLGYIPLEEQLKDEANPGLLVTMRRIEQDEKVEEFKEKLRLESWQTVKYDSRGIPHGHIYLSDNLHISVEGELADINYVLICTNEAYRYFNVPQDVYDYINSLCTLLK